MKTPCLQPPQISYFRNEVLSLISLNVTEREEVLEEGKTRNYTTKEMNFINEVEMSERMSFNVF